MNNLATNNGTEVSYKFITLLASRLIKKANISSPPVTLKLIFNTLTEKIIVTGQDLGGQDGFCINSKFISYNNTQSIERQRFTVAHELGHIQLGHTTSEKYISYDTKDPNEQAANFFASELLVPTNFLKKEAKSLLSLSELAKKYKVSYEMMMWKIKSKNAYSILKNWN